MVQVTVPGHRAFQLSHLVLDYNGTLACDGRLLDGVRERLVGLSSQLQVHVVTADTFGNAASELSAIPCKLSVLPAENQHTAKLGYVKQLGAEATVCIGNGRNDRLMLEEAALGILVIQEEGAAAETLLSSDIVCRDILSALDLLGNPKRLVATLRS